MSMLRLRRRARTAVIVLAVLAWLALVALLSGCNGAQTNLPTVSPLPSALVGLDAIDAESRAIAALCKANPSGLDATGVAVVGVRAERIVQVVPPVRARVEGGETERGQILARLADVQATADKLESDAEHSRRARILMLCTVASAVMFLAVGFGVFWEIPAAGGIAARLIPAAFAGIAAGGIGFGVVWFLAVGIPWIMAGALVLAAAVIVWAVLRRRKLSKVVSPITEAGR